VPTSRTVSSSVLSEPLSTRIPDIKFCGLTRAEDAALAEQLGAAFLGAIRAGGPRLLTPEQWQQVLGAPRPGVARVAVLGAMSASQVVQETRLLGADIAQWHGDPDAGAVAGVAREGVRVWPVLRIASGGLPREAWTLSEHAEALVIDAKVPGQLGGTGVALDWDALAADVQRWRADVPHVRLVLAGGLTPANVAHAMSLLNPDVVDVSSGVELAPGIKDPERMRAFVHAVRGLE
jgi:phosphoribosylanthranilate isomerase